MTNKELENRVNQLSKEVELFQIQLNIKNSENSDLRRRLAGRWQILSLIFNSLLLLIPIIFGALFYLLLQIIDLSTDVDQKVNGYDNTVSELITIMTEHDQIDLHYDNNRFELGSLLAQELIIKAEKA